MCEHLPNMIQKIVGLSNDSKKSSLELQYSWLLAMDEVYKIASAQQKKVYSDIC